MKEEKNNIVTLVRRDNHKSEELFVEYNSSTKEIRVFLDGQEIDMGELIRTYEDPIKDIMCTVKENESKKNDKDLDDAEEKIPERYAGVVGKDKEEKVSNKLEKDNMEKEKSEENNEKVKSREKPQYVIQTVDLDQTYVDKLHTLRTQLKLPSEVKELAFAYPNSEEDRKLSDDLTVFMLDKDGRKIEEVNGKKITDILEVDDSTGDNPMYDDNTKLELEGYAEKNKNMTMKRFKAIGSDDNDFYLSVEQKEIGQYAEIYAGGKNSDGNDSVEVELETDNMEVQTSLEMQEIIDGRRGMYNEYNIDTEADLHEKHGDDVDKIAKQNADGDKTTMEICDEDLIPGTDTTWRQFANMCGYRGTDSLEKAQKELENYKKDYPDVDNKQAIEGIQEKIENEMPGPNRGRG